MTDTKTVLLHFDCFDLPAQVRLGFKKFYVKRYIPMPLRCLNAIVSGTLQKNVEAKNGAQNVARNTTHLLAVSQM